MNFFEGIFILILGIAIAYGVLCYQPLREKVYSWQDAQVEQPEEDVQEST